MMWLQALRCVATRTAQQLTLRRAAQTKEAVQCCQVIFRCRHGSAGDRLQHQLWGDEFDPVPPSGDLADPIPEPEEPGAPLLPPLSVPAQAAFAHTASRLQAWDGGSALIRDEFEVSNALNVALHLERLASASVPTCLQTEGLLTVGSELHVAMFNTAYADPDASDSVESVETMQANALARGTPPQLRFFSSAIAIVPKANLVVHGLYEHDPSVADAPLARLSFQPHTSNSSSSGSSVSTTPTLQEVAAQCSAGDITGALQSLGVEAGAQKAVMPAKVAALEHVVVHDSDVAEEELQQLAQALGMEAEGSQEVLRALCYATCTRQLPWGVDSPLWHAVSASVKGGRSSII